MVRLRSKLGSATVLLLIVGAVLTGLALFPRTYEAETTVFTSTTSDGTAPPAPDESAMRQRMQALFPDSAAKAHQVLVVPEPGTYFFRVVARDREPAEAARRANVAAQDLVTADDAHHATLGGDTMKTMIVAPASTPPLQDRSPFTLGAVLAFAAALGLVSMRPRRPGRSVRTAS